jgi:hypothetical protein
VRIRESGRRLGLRVELERFASIIPFPFFSEICVTCVGRFVWFYTGVSGVRHGALHIGLGLGRLDEDEDYADREFQCDPRSEKKIKYAEQASVTVANHILEAAGVAQWLIFISYRGGAVSWFGVTGFSLPLILRTSRLYFTWSSLSTISTYLRPNN